VGLRGLGDGDDHFLKRFWRTLTSDQGWQGLSVRHWHGATVMVGVGTIVLVVAIRKINDWLRHKGARFPIPQHLVAVTIMATVVWALHLHQDDANRGAVKIVGYIPASLPRFEAPHFHWDQVR